jgi:hypothetical protein
MIQLPVCLQEAVSFITIFILHNNDLQLLTQAAKRVLFAATDFYSITFQQARNTEIPWLKQAAPFQTLLFIIHFKTCEPVYHYALSARQRPITSLVLHEYMFKTIAILHRAFKI